MQLRNGRSFTGVLLVLAGLAAAACSPKYVVVPQRARVSVRWVTFSIRTRVIWICIPSTTVAEAAGSTESL